MWRENRDEIRGKSVHQILAFAGEGRLADHNNCSKEFRDMLKVVSLDVLERYASDALSSGAADPGLALQDIVNEIGARLGYQVEHGLYRGRKGEAGHDGLWIDPDYRHATVVEVKSSSTYRIKLESIAQYRAQLAREGKVENERSSILIVVGQSDEDTADLEAQIRGSRHAWEIRVVSLAALFRMVALSDATDNRSSVRILREILIPCEYTKLDSLSEMVRRLAQNVSAVTAIRHQIITALWAIEAMAMNLREGYVPSEEKEVYLQAIASKATMCKWIVCTWELLQRMSLESLDRGSLEFKPLAVHSLFAKLAGHLSSLGSDFDVQIRISEGMKSLPLIPANEATLQHALGNLLDNGIRYGREHTEVTIEGRKVGKNVTVVIENQGIPLRKEDAEMIFNYGTRTEEAYSSRAPNGVGLGLWLAKKVVEDLHQGVIWAEPTDSRGFTRFYISLPVVRR